MSWEYLVEADINHNELQDTCDGRGAQNWELVSCLRFERLVGPYGHEQRAVLYDLVFKRPR